MMTLIEKNAKALNMTIAEAEEQFDNGTQMLWMDIEDHGYCCEDGHWLTEEEFYQWTPEKIAEVFEEFYDESIFTADVW